MSGQDSHSIVEFKAATFTLPVIRLLGTDPEAVTQAIGAKVHQAPDFFRNTPVVLDLAALPTGEPCVFPPLIDLMRGYGMIPVGVRGGTDDQNRAARDAKLAVLNESPAHHPHAKGDRRETATDAPSPPAVSHSKIITKPVRSGQQVYAADGDLSILASVSSGAEITAVGNIHVYGALRGRAMAGVRGDQRARIFCRDLQAELISVAGYYRVSENIPQELKGQAVQIFLEGEFLRIERF